MKLPYKYELPAEVVTYLINAVNAQQIRGEQSAKALVGALNILRSPLNLKELQEEEKKEQETKRAEEKKETK